jgi:hypothetical protein
MPGKAARTGTTSKRPQSTKRVSFLAVKLADGAVEERAKIRV